MVNSSHRAQFLPSSNYKITALRLPTIAKSPSLYNARCDQLLNLRLHSWISHGLVSRVGVLIEVPQHLLHDRIRQYGLNLRVCHGMLSPLLPLLLGHGRRTPVDKSHDLLKPRLARGILWLDCQPCLVAVHRFVVLLHHYLDVPLPRPSLQVSRVDFQGLLDLPLGTIEVHDFAKSRTQVVTDGCILRGTFHCLLILIHCLGPFLVPEMVISSLLGLLGLGVILIIHRVLLLFLQLKGFEQSGCGLVDVLQIRLLAHFNGFAHIPLLLVRLCSPRQCLGPILKRGAVLLTHLHRLVACCDTFVIFFSREVYCRLIGVERHTHWVQFDCFVIRRKSLLEFLRFVQFIPPLLGPLRGKLVL
mmetsp:Transcript_41519/g.125824  ORF Transcript_41519/g.125824 Transcript_41519/m.125824 type:complete len:359 (-) Transcript_41519:864-1940(-)